MKLYHSLFFISLCVLALTLNSVVHAQNKVVVIPLFGGEAESLQNVVTVAQRNGDFTDPVAAVNSITDASASNPYIIVIAPGVYNLTTQLVMREYVSISGSGKQTTFLRGSISSNGGATSAIIVGADNTELSDISIENREGTELVQTGLYIEQADRMTVYRSNITVSSSNSRFTTGLTIIETGLTLTEVSGFQIIDSEINNTSIAVTNKTGIDASLNFGTIVIDNSLINAGFGGISIRNESSTIRAHGNQLIGDIDNLADLNDANTYISDSIFNGSISNNENGLGTTTQVLCDFVFKVDGSSLDANCE